MTIEFSLAGLLVPKPIKIICFSLDQLKQTASSAIVVDGFQLFFCCCYLSRVTFLKIMKYSGEEIPGYGKGCSIATDIMVILCFFIKFYLSQQTNYHDIEAILNDNHKDHDQEEYIEMIHYANYFLE